MFIMSIAFAISKRFAVFSALAVFVFLSSAQVCASEEAVQVYTIPGVESFRVGAKAAVVMEATTGKILFAQNENERLPIASTTKILTSLIALEQPDIDAEFKVDSGAILVEGSSMGLQEGDTVTLRALAVGMLLASGNDGANSAAVRIAGSVPAFATLMNERAEAIGMVDSSFETPSGLDGEHHYSTAKDMALLAREALRNDLFREICSQYKMRTSYGNPPYDRWLTNHNRLLNSYDGTIGVKTGFTKKAGRCLVSAAQRDGVTLICVTLSSPDDWNVHKSLYDRFFVEIEAEDLSTGVPQINVPVTGGTLTEVPLIKCGDAVIPVPVKGSAVRYETNIPQFLYAPVAVGQFIGDVKIYLDDQYVALITLVAANDVPLLHPYEEKRSIIDHIKEIFKKS